MNAQTCPKAVGESSLKEEGKNSFTVPLKKDLWLLSKRLWTQKHVQSLKSSAEHKRFSHVDCALQYSTTPSDLQKKAINQRLSRVDLHAVAQRALLT